MCPPDKTSRHGFGRLDVIVGCVLGIMMITLVVPYLVQYVIHPVRETTSRDVTRWQIQGMAKALHAADAAQGRLPPTFDKYGQLDYPASAHVHLLPYLEAVNVYNQYCPHHLAGSSNHVVPAFYAPNDESNINRNGLQNFSLNLRAISTKGLETPYDANLPPLASIEPGRASLDRTFTDGRSYSIMVATRYGICGSGGSRYAAAPNSPFAAFFGQNAAEIPAHRTNTKATFLLKPHPLDCSPTPLQAHALSPKSLQVGLADGSARTIGFTISPETWNRLLHPSDGLPLPTDW